MYRDLDGMYDEPEEKPMKPNLKLSVTVKVFCGRMPGSNLWCVLPPNHEGTCCQTNDELWLTYLGLLANRIPVSQTQF